MQNFKCISCNKILKSGHSKFCNYSCRHAYSFFDNSNNQQRLDRMKIYYDKHVIRSIGCWDWNGSKSHRYPRISCCKKMAMGIHRFSWIYNFGPIPNGLYVLHKCDNTRCSNPQHLFLGTIRDNTYDKYQKNRGVNYHGEENISAKINNQTAQQIKQLLVDGYSTNKIASMLDISIKIVSGIRCNKNWRYIPWPDIAI